MTTQAILIEPAPRAAPYPDAPPRDDMQNLIYLEKRSIVEALTYHFGNSDATLIGEIRLGPQPERSEGYPRSGSDGSVQLRRGASQGGQWL